jgi:asparagine synthase (glutamine-hydrolysing)
MKPDHTSPETTTPLLSPSIGKEKGLGVEGGSWLLRWNPDTQPSPEILLPQEPRSDFAAHLQTGPAGFVLFEGYLFDKTDYLSDPDASPAACVARAYADYGEEVFDRLRGGYALAVWDNQRKRLLAGRDAMGLHPCYYYWDGQILLLSSELDLLLEQAEVPGKFNRLALVEYLQSIWHAHQRCETFYEGVDRLPPAHCIILADRSLEVRRYWDPLPPGFEWADEAELQTFQPALERAVSRCLQAGADSLSLSGGFDSVSLAVLAAEQLNKNGKSPLHALSLRFDIAGSDEWEIQSAVARRLGMPQVMRSLSEFMRAKWVVADTLHLVSKCPLPVSGLLQSMYRGLLESGSLEGLDKLLMGTGGDEMYVVDVGYAMDCLTSLDLTGLWRYYRTIARASSSPSLHIARNIFWSFTAKLILVQGIRSTLEALSQSLANKVRTRHLALEDWLLPSDPVLKETVLDRRLCPPEVEMAPGEGSYIRAIRGLVQSSYLMSSMDQSYAWTGQAGFTLLYPYFDRDLVELSLRMPPEYLISGDLDKAPLRRLVAERLPAVRLSTKKAGFTPTYDAILREHGLAPWRELQDLHMLAGLGLVHPERLVPLIEGYFSGQNNRTLLTWSVLSAESWLRAHSN